ncbi:MAG TPA: hypothetical protein DEQ38_14245 [Elusimicrobia bacterium]|nr:MAG: hypothetical protein A2089_07045 [Elusimicrobia bacterium GWD2_63_28]HCC49258.1 hypothetical protein [Elusimicrobiota bacterium]
MKKKKCYLYNFPSLSSEVRVREPSILYCVPDAREWDTEFVFDNAVRPDGDLYLCSVFTCGLPDFKAFSKQVGASRIIAGGYHPSLRPQDFKGLAGRIVVGFGNNIDELIAGPRGVVRGKFRPNHMDRSVFPVDKLKEFWFADIYPGRRSLSINTFMGCPFPCDFAGNCYIYATYKDKKHFYPASYIRKELKLLSRYDYDYLFIRDEGFFLHPEFDEILALLARSGKKIYSFLGPLGGLTAEKMARMKAAGWFCFSFGFNVQEGCADDPEKLRVAELAHKCGINLHLNLMIRGARDKRSAYYLDTVDGILRRYLPASTEMYFWTPYPGTRSFEDFRVKFPDESYRLLSHIDFKAGSRALLEGHQRRLFDLQVAYYKSRDYAKLRNFNCGDTLNLQVNELLRARKKA